MDITRNVDIGARFRTARQRQLLTCEHVAAHIGISETRLYAIEQGIQEIGLEEFICLCAYLHLNADYAYWGKSYPSHAPSQSVATTDSPIE